MAPATEIGDDGNAVATEAQAAVEAASASSPADQRSSASKRREGDGTDTPEACAGLSTDRDLARDDFTGARDESVVDGVDGDTEGVARDGSRLRVAGVAREEDESFTEERGRRVTMDAVAFATAVACDSLVAGGAASDAALRSTAERGASETEVAEVAEVAEAAEAAEAARP